MHKPVLLKEVIEILNPQPGEFFIDGTIGNGGHAAAILEKIEPTGKFLGMDWDKNAIEKLKIEKLKDYKNVILRQGNYADLPEILRKNNLPKADGLLLDLGFSSEQLESGRGFSFLKDEPLDMRYCASRMNADSNADERGYISVNQRSNQRESAAVVVNSYDEKELADIFWKYGEERFSRQFAKKITEERRKKRILTTFELIDAIKKAAPKSYERGRIHPATRVFQALRIYVNNELGNLETLLQNLDKILVNKSRAAIISFHSLEDRLVKNYFREMEKSNKAKILTKKPIRPTEEEIKQNPRSRSAKLRALYKI